jgi:hypothetical protein
LGHHHPPAKNIPFSYLGRRRTTYDSGLSTNVTKAEPVTVGGVAGAGYCIQATVGSHSAAIHGPGGTTLSDRDPGYAACP